MTKIKKHQWVGKWVVVTTDKQGVFYGRLKEYNREKDYLVLNQAKMIIYWSERTRGVLGLASTGPAEESRVSSEVPAIELNGITSIMLASEEAIKRFQEEIWS